MKKTSITKQTLAYKVLTGRVAQCWAPVRAVAPKQKSLLPAEAVEAAGVSSRDICSLFSSCRPTMGLLHSLPAILQVASKAVLCQVPWPKARHRFRLRYPQSVPPPPYSIFPLLPPSPAFSVPKSCSTAQWERLLQGSDTSSSTGWCSHIGADWCFMVHLQHLTTVLARIG